MAEGADGGASAVPVGITLENMIVDKIGDAAVGIVADVRLQSVELYRASGPRIDERQYINI